MTSAVLLVEDDDELREAVADLLKAELGVLVLEAGDGERGLALALEARPALIVVDQELPGITGEELARRLRAEPATASIPIVSFSASPPPPDALYDEYVPKRGRTDRLVAAIRPLLPPGRFRTRDP